MLRAKRKSIAISESAANPMTVLHTAFTSVVSGSSHADALDQYLSWTLGLYLLILPLGLPGHLHLQTHPLLKSITSVPTPGMLSQIVAFLLYSSFLPTSD